MLTITQINQLASSKMLNAKISKPQIASKLMQEAKDLKAYAALVKGGYSEGAFLKLLHQAETEIKRREDTFLGIMEHNREQAKEYHKESSIQAFYHKANLLKLILEINN